MNSQGCLISIYLAREIQDTLNMNRQCGMALLAVLPYQQPLSLLQETQKVEKGHRLPEVSLRIPDTWDSIRMETTHLEG